MAPLEAIGFRRSWQRRPGRHIDYGAALQLPELLQRGDGYCPGVLMVDPLVLPINSGEELARYPFCGVNDQPPTLDFRACQFRVIVQRGLRLLH